MSDNITPDEIKRRLHFLSIPAEVWTDVLKLLPRRILVQNIALACYRLKEISDKNVKSIHVIENANQFNKKLVENDTEANQQMEQLAGNKCQLASQFKLIKVRISEKSKAILRHCTDLFNGCQITLNIEEVNKNSALFLECLSELEKAKPVAISASQRVDQAIDYWHHPTFQNCSRAYLSFWSGLSAATMVNIFDWLHHQPSGRDSDGSADQQVRCIIVYHTGFGHDHVDRLINRCSEDIQQARDPTDRHSFVLSFYFWDWPGFGQFRRIENKSTGEVLTLERKMYANGQATNRYRLRRCLAEEEANGAVFYAGMFKRNKGVWEEFNTDEKKPKVMIR